MTKHNMDAQMRAAYALRGIPLWVPPSEVDMYLHCANWSDQICIELRDWFARVWSMSFAAGFRRVNPPKMSHSDASRMLIKMGYGQERAEELASILIDGIPGLYKKGGDIAGVGGALVCR